MTPSTSRDVKVPRGHRHRLVGTLQTWQRWGDIIVKESKKHVVCVHWKEDLHGHISYRTLLLFWPPVKFWWVMYFQWLQVQSFSYTIKINKTTQSSQDCHISNISIFHTFHHIMWSFSCPYTIHVVVSDQKTNHQIISQNFHYPHPLGYICTLLIKCVSQSL